jgi:predicted permease
MLKNYLKIALRNLRRHKGFSFINLSGLALGMACALLISFWVRDELSYDRFHENADDLYRVVVEWKENSALWAKTPGPLAAAMKAEIPEVVSAARIHKRPKLVMRYGEKAFYEEAKLRVDPEIFEIFSFPFAKGSRESWSAGIVLTESMARKYFGDEEPVGKTLNINNWFDVPVAGVLRDLPRNSYIQFDCALQLEPLKRFWPGGFTWGNFAHETFVQLREGADPQAVSVKIEALLRKSSPQISPYLNKLYLQPLTDVYLTANIGGGQFANGDRKYVYIFSVVAFFVLLIACINFMNLSTARALNRAKEIGVRKVAGSSRAQLLKQFLGEAVLHTAFAALFALLLVEIFLPAFNQLAGKQLTLTYSEPRLLLGLLLITLVTGVIAGSYPAVYLSSFKPIAVLKGGAFEKSGKRTGLRSALVVLQFALSILLMIGTLVIHRQLRFMTHAKLGFDKDNVIYVPAKENFGAQYEAVRQELLQYPEILGVAANGSVPTNTVNTNTLVWEGKPRDREYPIEVNAVDYDYFDLLNVQFVAGRNFSRQHAIDATTAFILNEEAAQLLGVDSPVGKGIRVGQKAGTIIGVAQNAHFKSMRQKIPPQVFHVLADYHSELVELFGIVMVKVRGNDIPQALARIEAVWKKVNPNFPFEYHFLDETYDRLYNQEQRTSVLFNYFTILAMAVSCLGLFGLAAFVAENRTKEIGIRKVLGASAAGIVGLLSKDFVKLVLYANLLAWPIAYFAAHQWLADFAYRIDLGFWIFALAGGVALLIALLTVSTQAIKAALANPVEALRYE